MIPETPAEIEDLLGLLHLDVEHLQQTVERQMTDEAKHIPVPYTFMIMPEQVEQVEVALSLFQEQGDRSAQFIALCKHIVGERDG